MHDPNHGLGILLGFVAISLVAGARVASKVTDPINSRLTGREVRSARGYVLVGIGLLIVAAAVFSGL